jgi:TM2 domain-containing membrane protein YozV
MRPYTNSASHKTLTNAIVLVLLGFIGLAGFHRFYTGKIGTGILWFVTCGFFGIGTLIDLIVITTGNYRCSNGEPLYN